MREIKRLSVHQWLRSAISDSQQPSSPIGFLFLKLPPPPCAVLLVTVPCFLGPTSTTPQHRHWCGAFRSMKAPPLMRKCCRRGPCWHCWLCLHSPTSLDPAQLAALGSGQKTVKDLGDLEGLNKNYSYWMLMATPPRFF